LNPGDPVPAEISLLDHRGKSLRLKDFEGHNIILYFYPMDDTPGCTVEGKEFRDLHDQFVALDCVVLGTSVDSVESHRAFAEKHAFPFLLLSDSEKTLSEAFGVLKGGVAARSTFVIDRDLRLRRAFHDVTPRGHAQQVLAFVRTIIESHRMLGG
jgi:thioredoxin-dependent peroxiredoxin